MAKIKKNFNFQSEQFLEKNFVEHKKLNCKFEEGFHYKAEHIFETEQYHS